METGKKYWRWGWWAIIGLVAILILIGLVIAAIASRTAKTADNTASVVETTVQDTTEEEKSTVKKEENTDKKSEKKTEKTETTEKKEEKKESNSTSIKKNNKKEEPAVVTRCKSKAYMEKTLKGGTNLDCNSAAGIAEFKRLENSGGTTTTPDSSAGVEVYDNSGDLPKSGPEDVLPIFMILAMGGFMATSMVMRYAKRER